MSGSDARLLAERLGDDSVWKGANLVFHVDFGDASYLYDTGIVPHDMPVEQVDVIGRLSDAWRYMLSHPDNAASNRYYQSMFGATDATDRQIDGEDEAVRFFVDHLDSNPLYGFMRANHALVDANVGLLAVSPQRLPALRASDDKTDFIKNEGIEDAGTGLNRRQRECLGTTTETIMIR